jgi:hypothetical protein
MLCSLRQLDVADWIPRTRPTGSSGTGTGLWPSGHVAGTHLRGRGSEYNIGPPPICCRRVAR